MSAQRQQAHTRPASSLCTAQRLQQKGQRRQHTGRLQGGAAEAAQVAHRASAAATHRASAASGRSNTQGLSRKWAQQHTGPQPQVGTATHRASAASGRSNTQGLSRKWHTGAQSLTIHDMGPSCSARTQHTRTTSTACNHPAVHSHNARARPTRLGTILLCMHTGTRAPGQIRAPTLVPVMCVPAKSVLLLSTHSQIQTHM